MGEGEDLSQRTDDHDLAAPPQQARTYVDMVYEGPDDFYRMGASCLIVQHLLQLGDLAAIDVWRPPTGPMSKHHSKRPSPDASVKDDGGMMRTS